MALAGAFLSGAEGLILDEPSNHLDAAHRERLIAALQRWHGGLIVISHDRALLNSMARIVELSPAGLRHYGGNYALYAAQKQGERRSADTQLALRKRERRQQQTELRDQRERMEHRQARATRDARTANQAPILLGGMKNRSEHSAAAGRRSRASAVPNWTRACARPPARWSRTSRSPCLPR